MTDPIGFFMFPRRLYSNCGHFSPASWRVLIHILASANVRPGVFMGRQIKPGQLACSVATLSNACGISTRQTRCALEGIRNANVVTIETTNQYSVITVLDWHTYSGNPDDKRQTEWQTEGQALRQTNDKREGNNQISNNSIREKEEEERVRVESVSPPPPAPLPSAPATSQTERERGAYVALLPKIREFLSIYPGERSKQEWVAEKFAKRFAEEAPETKLSDWWEGEVMPGCREYAEACRKGLVKTPQEAKWWADDRGWEGNRLGIHLAHQARRVVSIDDTRHPDYEGATEYVPSIAERKAAESLYGKRPDCMKCSDSGMVLREGATFDDLSEVPCPDCSGKKSATG